MGVMSIREFNTNISKAFAQAESGEDIVLTRNGKKVLRLTTQGVDEQDGERAANLARLIELMDVGIGLGGRATYEERTGR